MADAFPTEPGLSRRLEATELALFLFSRLSPLNLVVLARLAGPALDGVLPQALAAAQARHPLLRSRITGPRRRPRFEVSPASAAAAGPGPIPLRLAGVASGGGTGPDLAYPVVQAELRTPFDPGRGPLARVTYLPGGPGSDLVVTLHHSIADGISAANLVHELLGWCAARLAGDPVPPADPAAMPAPLTAVLPASMRGPRRIAGAFALALRQGGDEVAYRTGSMRRRRPIPPPGQAATIPFGLDRDGTADLVDRARRRRLTLTSLLSAALLWQASIVLYGARPVVMRAVVWVDLRPHLSPSPPAETLGCYASMLRFVVRVDPRDGFGALAERVQDRIERTARRGDRVPAALASAGIARLANRLPVGRLSTTALSYAAAPAIGARYGPITVREVRGFVSNVRLGSELAATAGLAEGALWCNVLYLDSELDEPTATAAGEGLLATLLDFARPGGAA